MPVFTCAPPPFTPVTQNLACYGEPSVLFTVCDTGRFDESTQRASDDPAYVVFICPKRTVEDGGRGTPDPLASFQVEFFVLTSARVTLRSLQVDEERRLHTQKFLKSKAAPPKADPPTVMELLQARAVKQVVVPPVAAKISKRASKEARRALKEQGVLSSAPPAIASIAAAAAPSGAAQSATPEFEVMEEAIPNIRVRHLRCVRMVGRLWRCVWVVERRVREFVCVEVVRRSALLVGVGFCNTSCSEGGDWGVLVAAMNDWLWSVVHDWRPYRNGWREELLRTPA